MTRYYSVDRFPDRTDFFNVQSGDGKMTWETAKLWQVHVFFGDEAQPLSIEEAQQEFSKNAAREDTAAETAKLFSHVYTRSPA